MGSKSEADTTLDIIYRYAGAENEIFMDNATGKTGYNTEIQRVERLARMEVLTTEPYYP